MNTKFSTSMQVFFITFGIGFSVSTYADTRPSLQSLQSDVNSIQNNVNSIQTDVNSIQTDVNTISTYLTQPTTPNHGSIFINNTTIDFPYRVNIISPDCQALELPIGISYSIDNNLCSTVVSSQPNGQHWSVDLYVNGKDGSSTEECASYLKNGATVTSQTLCLHILPTTIIPQTDIKP